VFQQQSVGVLKLGLGTPAWFVSFDPGLATFTKGHVLKLYGTLRGYGTDALRYLFLQAEDLGLSIVRCHCWEQTQPGFRYPASYR